MEAAELETALRAQVLEQQEGLKGVRDLLAGGGAPEGEEEELREVRRCAPPLEGAGGVEGVCSTHLARGLRWACCGGSACPLLLPVPLPQWWRL